VREPERLAGFVYETARNVINNYLRARSRSPREHSIDAALHLATPPDAVDDSERIALVRRALASLQPTDRKILLLTLRPVRPGKVVVELQSLAGRRFAFGTRCGE
jgi:DNA-directed RNA polymerase specialized sigma24 family protein